MNSKLFRNVIKVEFQVSNISLMMAIANTSYLFEYFHETNIHSYTKRHIQNYYKSDIVVEYVGDTDLDIGPAGAGVPRVGVGGVQLEALDDVEELVQIEVCGGLPRRHAEHVLPAHRGPLARPRPGHHGPCGAPGVQGVRGARRQGVHWQGDHAAPWQGHTDHVAAWIRGWRWQHVLSQQRLVNLVNTGTYQILSHMWSQAQTP